MTRKVVLFIVLGIIFLIVPAAIYLVFLIPKMSEAYIVLMSSAGIVGGTGVYAISKIPESFKYSGLFKTAARAFDLLVVMTLVQDFLPQILGLVVVVVISFIVFKIFMECAKNERRKARDKELSSEIARSITENSK